MIGIIITANTVVEEVRLELLYKIISFVICYVAIS